MIGTGGIADLHAAGYMKSENAKIVGVTDLDHGLAEVKAKKFGAQTVFDSVDELLAEPTIEAVDIAVPTAYHAALAVKALEAGKHVMLEKPMARTVQECDMIINAAQKADAKLMVNHNLTFFPPYVFCKKTITEGGIGKLIRMRATQMAGHRYSGWRADPDLAGGGLLIEGLVHPLYLSRWFIGEIQELVAVTGKTDENVRAEDIVNIILKSKDGYSSVDGNLNGPPPLWDDHLEFVGTKGLLTANGAETQIYRVPPVMYYHDGLWTAYREKSYEGWDFPNEIEWNYPKSFINSTGEFVASIMEDRDPKVTGADGRRLIEIVQACYESARTKRVVSVG
jgi:UDP-N-acetylglucosamine 3-dehydrogenase